MGKSPTVIVRHLMRFGEKLCLGMLFQVTAKVLDIVLRLEPDQIILQKALTQPSMTRHRRKDIDRWKRYVQKESDPVRTAAIQKQAE